MTLLRTNVADDANKEWRDVVDHRWRIDALAAADECDAQAIIVRTWRGGGYEDSASTFSMELRGPQKLTNVDRTIVRPTETTTIIRRAVRRWGVRRTARIMKG